MKRRSWMAAASAALATAMRPGLAQDARAKTVDGTAFDVIIVGGGAAGSAMAYRLSSDARTRVLLLEAGPDERPAVLTVPARWPESLATQYNYGYSSVAQKAAGGRVIPQPRGRVLGGTTCLNAMIFAFPPAEDFARWGPLWSYPQVARSLHVMESHRGRGRGRGTTGPVRNGPARERHPLCADFVKAAVQAGHPACDDLNAPGARGAGWFDLSIDDKGERLDAAQTYIRPVRSRKNLQVWADCAVTRIELTGDRVTALRLKRTSGEEILKVSGEVVVSAGAIDSPALLLRSGIGPREELETIGVTCVLDLPAVGRNLRDHPALPVAWSTDQAIAPPRNQFSESTLYLPHEKRAGGRTLTMAFTHVAVAPGVSGVANGATAIIGLYEPRSSGSLKLNPANPTGAPLIDPGYLTDERDVDALVGSISLARKIAGQAALAGYHLREVTPGLEGDDPNSLRQMVRQNVISYGHQCGTCAMGETGVVDQRLRVRGMANLRVADASIFPTIPQVAPSVLVQLVGWHGARLIAEDLRASRKARSTA
ncbi:GMC family oxidoreductase [Ramlibacter sp. WS9]|uniref:GMC family oxidoreductase n=1 Tax=Ramlibacter sp. WS9 TaxID=1882741 RepID=UPI0011450A6E|nr:GMC family oxidoreductase [Ramlibacter sp. WS9]ROZ75079.1 GMC family oxidoreductase [Ramlibacter sp. WS9]